MANVENSYCALEDLRTGDLSVPSYTSREQYVVNAAEEIDIALGHIYVTPFVIPEIPENRPTLLFLKKANWLLASGRFILDVAAASEADNLHAYGKRMLDEATAMLKTVTRDINPIILVGAELLPTPGSSDNPTGPLIHNEDEESLVEGFYRQRRPGIGLGLAESYPYRLNQVRPYGE